MVRKERVNFALKVLGNICRVELVHVFGLGANAIVSPLGPEF